jgi:uncharacterized protein (DUF58 family)
MACLVGGALAIVIGWPLGWLELVVVGMALIVLAFSPLLRGSVGSATWVDVSTPVRVVRGDSATVAIDLEVGPGSLRWVSAVDDSTGQRTWLPAASSEDSSPRSVSLEWPIDSTRRGLFEVGPHRLVVADPFGLRSATLASRDRSPVLVVPRIHPIPVRELSAIGQDEREGDRPGSDHFHSLREYVVGDPMKAVHWKASAKSGTLMVRRMVDTTIPWALVVLDVNTRAYNKETALFDDLDSEAFEAAVDETASWAWALCGPQQRVLLTTTSAMSVPLEITSRNRESGLDWLALVGLASESECGASRIAALARRQGVSRVTFVTGRNRSTSASWVSRWGRIAPVTVVEGSA